MINIFQPTLGADELAAVGEVFASSWVGRGPRTADFEAAFAGHVGVDRSRMTSISCCSEGLFLSMQLVGAVEGTEVVLPTVSFVSAANAIAATGARPVFCDVDPRTLMPSAEDVEAVLTPATKAVVVLHYGGYPGDVVRIADLCRQRGIKLIEDSACSVASRVDGRACGVIGDIGVWSFDSQKILVTGDGGMLTAADPQVVERARKLAYLGLEQTSGFTQAKVSDARWWDIEVSSFSRRSIMNDIQSAIGLVQLARLEEFVGRRRRIAEFYDREFAGQPGLLTPPPLPAGHESSYYMYWVQMPREIRDAVARDLYDDGVYTSFRYPALHLVGAFASQARLPEAETAVETTLCLPLHQGLSDSDAAKVVESLLAAVRRRLATTAAA